jgi:hypothetical protein
MENAVRKAPAIKEALYLLGRAPIAEDICRRFASRSIEALLLSPARKHPFSI